MPPSDDPQQGNAPTPRPWKVTSEMVWPRRRSTVNPRRNTAHHLLAGTSAGLLTTILLYPLDLVKTRYQVYNKSGSPYKSIGTALRSIMRAEGWTALYQGLGPALLGNGVAWGGYFYCYETGKAIMRRRTPTDELGSVHHLGAAMGAGVAMVLLTNPIWMIKTRMQLQNKLVQRPGVLPYKSFADAMVTIVAEEGPMALYKGVVPAVLLCTQGALQFMAYEWLKARIPRHDENTPLESLVMGGGSKIFASVVTYPSQVIKSRLQQRTTADGSPQYRGMWHCAREMARQDGPHGFFRGGLAYALRAAPASAITFVVYEEALKALSTSGGALWPP